MLRDRMLEGRQSARKHAFVPQEWHITERTRSGGVLRRDSAVVNEIPNRFTREGFDGALRHHFLNIAIAQPEAKVQPHAGRKRRAQKRLPR